MTHGIESLFKVDENNSREVAGVKTNSPIIKGLDKIGSSRMSGKEPMLRSVNQSGKGEMMK